ncbi:Glycine-rich cell wall structural protein precursor [Paramagnetospirillum magnetotacticum MS-1]|uniref:Glycine-rich cell wall structural protein n=1 Tax=Paramagnetospirillum magnetotacticum MS-1 TaxID=272627 RepID=A0A0C2U5T6_PARME|nr:autotransporter outer membrane beta-barrel domain-containing protein [Paramagnetospirillum magnetotacticum]KIL96812.1 Glycine-rich cell wall structural protein precursor [Paramagnetospirillum magnetotacticum MS-1]
MINDKLLALLAATGALAAIDPAFAGCDVVPATQQASTAASTNTAGLIASRVTSVVTTSTGGGTRGSSSGGTNTGGGSTTTGSGGSLNAASSGCGTTTTTDTATLSEDETISRQGAGAAQAREQKINSIWVASSVTWLKKTDRNGDYGGTVTNGIVGYDRRLTNDLIGGIAVGYEKVMINTKYVANGGSVEGNTVSVSPYLGYSINDWLVIDGVAGFARIQYRFKSNSQEVGEANANRLFGASNLTAYQRYDDTIVKAAIGYLRIAEFQGSYTSNQNTFNRESLANFGQVRATLSAGHDLKTSYGLFTPNVFARYEYDLPHAQKVDLAAGYRSTNDPDGMTFGIGLDFAIDDLKINVGATTAQFRDNFESYGLDATVRYAF